jgi:hypothetical protein
MQFSAENLLELIKALGWAKGVFTVFFFMAHAYIFSLYRGRLSDRQKEIDRIAAENREYRERFLKLMDDKFSYPPSQKKSRKR